MQDLHRRRRSISCSHCNVYTLVLRRVLRRYKSRRSTLHPPNDNLSRETAVFRIVERPLIHVAVLDQVWSATAFFVRSSTRLPLWLSLSNHSLAVFLLMGHLSVQIRKMRRISYTRHRTETMTSKAEMKGGNPVPPDTRCPCGGSTKSDHSMLQSRMSPMMRLISNLQSSKAQQKLCGLSFPNTYPWAEMADTVGNTTGSWDELCLHHYLSHASSHCDQLQFDEAALC